MSFLRQQQIYPPIGSLICTGGGPLSGFAPGLIVWMSLPPAIPWQVALPQSLPPLRRVTLFCYKESGRSMDFQRTANSGLTGCLSRGVHPIRTSKTKEAGLKSENVSGITHGQSSGNPKFPSIQCIASWSHKGLGSDAVARARADKLPVTQTFRC